MTRSVFFYWNGCNPTENSFTPTEIQVVINFPSDQIKIFFLFFSQQKIFWRVFSDSKKFSKLSKKFSRMNSSKHVLNPKIYDKDLWSICEWTKKFARVKSFFALSPLFFSRNTGISRKSLWPLPKSGQACRHHWGSLKLMTIL